MSDKKHVIYQKTRGDLLWEGPQFQNLNSTKSAGEMRCVVMIFYFSMKLIVITVLWAVDHRCLAYLCNLCICSKQGMQSSESNLSDIISGSLGHVDQKRNCAGLDYVILHRSTTRLVVVCSHPIWLKALLRVGKYSAREERGCSSSGMKWGSLVSPSVTKYVFGFQHHNWPLSDHTFPNAQTWQMEFLKIDSYLPNCRTATIM